MYITYSKASSKLNVKGTSCGWQQTLSKIVRNDLKKIKIPIYTFQNAFSEILDSNRIDFLKFY